MYMLKPQVCHSNRKR